ncbi:RNA polymerase sigma factor [Sphingobacterium litopenaei]|uniref:Sigma-70 family RNA polymerase sigma factor n=1 Tax=Sphingobacterium litopenaei TaxID=2763500 RepID=A0ABR7YBU8_9SPHI|nr:sigma-70 family RNA polymerase sigma factor [Sphingobacterium litopenaei]MBD1428762.1 sigma-70 family RNA polymerase sigma factor [Sphingobacterium litopenaei]
MNLIASIQKDNVHAFSKVYETFHREIYGFIFQRTKSEFLAEEVTQLTFIKAWKNRAKLNHTLPINIQLFGIAKQVMIDELRKEANRFKYEGEAAATPFTDNLIKALESKDLMRLIDGDIANMPPVRRHVFELSRKQGLTHKEIAQMLNISNKAVEQHISKALLQLKQHLYSIML